jgi:hypothetical protein
VILHLVMFRLKVGVTREDARVAAIVDAMDALPAQLPLIKGWQHGFNMTEDPQAWDYGLHALFDNEADLHAYFDHPAHLPVVEAWDEIAVLAFTDFRI